MTHLPVTAGLLMTFVAMSVALSGCSTFSQQKQETKPQAATSTDISAQCEQLTEIFNKSINGFKAIREQPDYHNKVTRWQTRYHLIDNSCDIWQWSDKYSYICSKSVPDQQMADSLYDDAGRIISQCLNNGRLPWQQKQVILDNQGAEARYSIDGLLRGSLRKVNTGGLFRDSWTVYFRVDSPGMNTP